MRKPKFLALVLVVAVMLMGAGYAQWTDILTIENTVTTGDMNVEFVDQSAASDDDDYVTASIVRSSDNKTETVTISDMYPGSVAVYATALQNKGTLPAAIENVQLTFPEVAPSLHSAELAEEITYIAGYTVVNEYGWLVPGKIGFAIGQDLNTFAARITNMLDGEVLEPGETLLFDIPEEYKDEAIEFMPEYANLDDNCFVFGLPGYVDNEDLLENEEVAFDIVINFGQENIGGNPDYSVNLDNIADNQ